MTNQTGMFPRFLMAFGLVLAYLAAWAVVFLFWVLLWRNANEAVLVIGILAATAVLLAIFIPYLNYVAKRAFCFVGEGQPAGENELRAMLLAVNDCPAPVSVKEVGKKLVVTWKYNDAKWWELLAKAGLKQIYELHIKLNDRKKEAVLTDVLKTVSWRAGPTEVKVQAGGFRGIYAGCQVGAAWGIKETFELGKTYAYKFAPQEIKNPIVNSILRSGWTVRFAIW